MKKAPLPIIAGLIALTFSSTNILLSFIEAGGSSAENSLPDIQSLWDFSDTEKTRKRFEDLISLHQKTAPKDYILELQTQIARTYSLESKFAEAHTILDSIDGDVFEASQKVKIRYRLERGRTFNSAGKKSEAVQEFIQAYTIANATGETYLAADAAHMVSLVTENFGEKVYWTERGIKIAELSADQKTKSWLGPLHNNLGWDYYERKDFGKALIHFTEAQKWHFKFGKESQKLWARFAVLATFRKMGQISEALTKLQELEAELSKEKSESLLMGYVKEEIGESLLANGEAAAAKPYFQAALKILKADSWISKNETGRLSRIEKLANQ